MKQDESQIDDWYNQERERLEERFTNTLRTTTDDNILKRSHEAFNKQYNKLIKEYQDRLRRLYESKQREESWRRPIEKAKTKIRELKMKTKEFIMGMKQGIRKWFFDRKIKRILKDKSDL